MKLTEVADKIARNEDITRDELDAIKRAVSRTNVWHKWNTDDIVGKFALAIRKNYNPKMDDREKAWWMFKTILWMCQDEWEIALKWTLYYKPTNIPIDAMSDNSNYIIWYEDMANDVNFRIMEQYFTEVLDEKELYVYEHNIKLWEPYKDTAEYFNLSPQMVEKIRDKMIKKVSNYIENRLK